VSKWDIQLPVVTPVEANVLGVSLAAPSAKAAYTFTELKHTWKIHGEPASFTLLRPGGRPLPTTKHCVILDALLCRFALNFNKEGELKFRLSDIARDLSKKDENANLGPIKEAIDRYFTCPAIWEGSFKLRGVMERSSWSGTIINYSSLHNSTVPTKNPRNQKDPNTWHRIEFNRMIVESIHSKNVRLIAAESLTLPCPQYQLYRWLRSWDDRRPVRCSLEAAQRVLQMERSRSSKFKKMMEGRLSGLKEAGYLLNYKVFATYFEVKMTPSETLKRRIKKKPEIDLDAMDDMGDRDDFDLDPTTVELTPVDESGRIKN
jgi:hypothetical protein